MNARSTGDPTCKLQVCCACAAPSVERVSCGVFLLAHVVCYAYWRAGGSVLFDTIHQLRRDRADALILERMKNVCRWR